YRHRCLAADGIGDELRDRPDFIDELKTPGPAVRELRQLPGPAADGVASLEEVTVEGRGQERRLVGIDVAEGDAVARPVGQVVLPRAVRDAGRIAGVEVVQGERDAGRGRRPGRGADRLADAVFRTNVADDVQTDLGRRRPDPGAEGKRYFLGKQQRTKAR